MSRQSILKKAIDIIKFYHGLGETTIPFELFCEESKLSVPRGRVVTKFLQKNGWIKSVYFGKVRFPEELPKKEAKRK